MSKQQEDEKILKYRRIQVRLPDAMIITRSNRKGLSREVVDKFSHMKGEPQWMLDFR